MVEPLEPHFREADLERLERHANLALAGLVPENATEEFERLVPHVERGRYLAAAFRYRSAPIETRDLGRLLVEWGKRDASPTGTLLAQRGLELLLEVDLCRTAGTPQFAAIAARRFFEGAESDAAAALAELWSIPSANRRHDSASLTCTSDGPEPTSLLSTTRRLLAREQLAFRVIPHSPMLALAATGQNSIFVAQNRKLTPAEVHGTAIHEVFGHARPRQRGRQPHRCPSRTLLRRLGTARGVDEQEGLALHYEERMGCLNTARKATLSMRHRAAVRMRAGAEFPELLRWLCQDQEIAPPQAVRIAMRIYRGSAGLRPGAARELAYLPAYLRVRGLLLHAPATEALLSCGQVATAAAVILEAVDAES
jgi:hypothetical protein